MNTNCFLAYPLDILISSKSKIVTFFILSSVDGEQKIETGKSAKRFGLNEMFQYVLFVKWHCPLKMMLCRILVCFQKKLLQGQCTKDNTVKLL